MMHALIHDVIIVIATAVVVVNVVIVILIIILIVHSLKMLIIWAKITTISQ